MRLITFSTLFPNAAQPAHGLFVEARLRELRQRRGVQADVVAPVPWFPFKSEKFGAYAKFARAPRRAERDGVIVSHPRYFLPPKVGMHMAPRSMARGASGAVASLVGDIDLPVLDAHYFYPDGVAAAHLASRLRLPLVITARGSDVNLLPDDAAVRRRMLWAADRASALVAVSSALRERMIALGMDAAKIRVLRNGVDLSLFKPLDRAAQRQALGLDGPMILSVGNLYQLKGHDLVIEALTEHPALTLVIAGAGPERAALGALAERLGVQQRVRFVGSVAQSELLQYYNAADLLVLASSREGMANVLLESLACGTPAVVTPVGGNPEVIACPEAGIVLPRRDARAVADGIGQLCSDLPSREATRRYAQKFSWDDVTRELHELFEEVSA
ncbi:MAG: glycosyltransferase family 4 protein [Gammaproteobacteria bacterium]